MAHTRWIGLSCLLLALVSAQVTDVAAQATAAPGAPSAASSPATPENVAPFLGDWTLSGQGQNGPATFALTVKNYSGKILAEISSDMMPRQAVSDITRFGPSLVIRYDFDYQGTPIPVVLTLTPGNGAIAMSMSFADGAYQMDGSAARKEAAK